MPDNEDNEDVDDSDDREIGETNNSIVLTLTIKHSNLIDLPLPRA